MSNLSIIITIFIFCFLSNIVGTFMRFMLELNHIKHDRAKIIGIIIGYVFMSLIVVIGVYVCGWKLL